MRGVIEWMTRSVRPASANPDEGQGPGGRGRDQARKRRLQQGPKTMAGLHQEVG
jgi:hypothetical protein